MSKDNIKEAWINSFLKELDIFLASKKHYYNCAAHSESQYCCCDKVEKKDEIRNCNPTRKFIIEYLGKYL